MSGYLVATKMLIREYRWLSNCFLIGLGRLRGSSTNSRTDDSFNDELAESLTRWAMDRLLPTTPVCVLPDLQIRMSENLAKLVLVHLLSARGPNPNTTRSAKLMSVLEDTLRLSPSELYGTVFHLIETEDDGEGTTL